MKKVCLHGFLGEKFGQEYELDVDSPAEAVRAMGVQMPGFTEAIKKGSWHIIRGPLDESDSVDEGGLTVSLGRQNEIHIIPAIEGANNGALNVVLGIVIIAVAWWNPAGWAAGTALMVGAAGAGLALSGIVMMTTKIPGVEKGSERGEEKGSYLFDGPVNTSKQNVAVPRGYGRVLTGSIVVSAGLFAEEYVGD